MSDDSHWETTVHSQGVSIEAPELDNLINLEAQRLKHLLDDPPDKADTTRSPPNITPDMLPGILSDIVARCCHDSESVAIAVAINVLTRFAALVGPMVYLPIGDERRLLNDFVLMVGPSGLGKGGSNHGPSRLYKRVEEYLALNLDQQFQAGKSKGISQYPNLTIHTGGLSSGEGLAATMNDGNDGEAGTNAVTDKRLLVFEPEFSNLMSMSQRAGNILSMVLRNAFDGSDIQPMTKRDKIKVTQPYICLFANITASELISHEQSRIMALNGMLNRFLILWQQPDKLVACPEPIPVNTLDQYAEVISQRILLARQGSHETHYKKIPGQARAVILSKEARQFWELHYGPLVNRPDCEQVMILTRRHRLHARILSALFALLDGRFDVSVADLRSALAWCEYSRQSVIYIFGSLIEQRKAVTCHQLAMTILQAIQETINKKKQCTASDLYRWFSGKIKRDQLSQALELLMNHIPPLIRQETKTNLRGRPSLLYCLTGCEPN